MKTGRTLISYTAILAVASPLAMAGPGDKGGDTMPLLKGLPRTAPTSLPELGNFTDNFDSYTAGQGLIGNGGWSAWYTTPGSDALVDDFRSLSPRNSLKLIDGTDVVQRLAITSGVWEFTIQTYVPANAPAGDGVMIIMLNQYGGPDNWSMQVALNETFFSGSQLNPYMIESQWDGALLPLILDQWVEFRAVIDLDNDTWDSWYGGTPLSTGLIWTDNGFSSGPGIPEMAAIDLWTSSAFGPPTIWLDDISLVQLGVCPCACSFDPDPLCDIFDFLAFQNLFILGDPCACLMEPDPLCDIFDFLAFQNEFILGCP